MAKVREHRFETRRAWKDVCEIAGIENFRIHDCRHASASFAVQSGSSLVVVGGLFGHAHAATTQKYAHLNDASLREAAERVGSIISKK
jgi:site-specific recombinase XerD